MSGFTHQLKQEKTLYFLLIGVGIILSLIKIQDSVINRDAIVYLSTAEAFYEQGVAGTFKTYSWPAYAIFGAILSKISHISLENCFYIINTILYSLIPAIFLRLYIVITNNRNALQVVALLVLLLPALNGYREMIIRDVGFWCFSLLALLSFLRYFQTKKFFYALTWQLSIGTAFFFRSEAVIWLIGLPFCLFFINTETFGNRFKYWLSSICFYMVILIIGIIIICLHDTALEILKNKLTTIDIFHNFAARLQNAQEKMALNVLNEYSSEYASLILSSGLLILLVHIVLSATSPIYLALATVAFFKRQTIKSSPENKIVLWALILNLIVLIAFLLSYQFMIERYAILTALLILLLISQPITQWAKNSWPQSRLITKYSFIFLTAIVFLDILISKNPPPTNLKSAGEWLKTNTSLDTPIALNDNRLLHYSGRIRKGTTCVIDKDVRVSLHPIDKLKSYSYLVIQTKKDFAEEDTKFLLQNNSFEKITEFTRGKSVIVIFKSMQPSADLAVDCNRFR